jgi:hypothetical protein
MVAKQLRSIYKLSMDIITRLIDNAIVTGNSQLGDSGKIYLYSILKDLICQGDVRVEDIDGIHDCLKMLSRSVVPLEEGEPQKKSVRRYATNN